MNEFKRDDIANRPKLTVASKFAKREDVLRELEDLMEADYERRTIQIRTNNSEGRFKQRPENSNNR